MNALHRLQRLYVSAQLSLVLRKKPQEESLPQQEALLDSTEALPDFPEKEGEAKQESLAEQLAKVVQEKEKIAKDILAQQQRFNDLKEGRHLKRIQPQQKELEALAEKEKELQSSLSVLEREKLRAIEREKLRAATGKLDQDYAALGERAIALMAQIAVLEQKKTQLVAENERKRLEAERNRIEAERSRMLEEQERLRLVRLVQEKKELAAKEKLRLRLVSAWLSLASSQHRALSIRDQLTQFGKELNESHFGMNFKLGKISQSFAGGIHLQIDGVLAVVGPKYQSKIRLHAETYNSFFRGPILSVQELQDKSLRESKGKKPPARKDKSHLDHSVSKDMKEMMLRYLHHLQYKVTRNPKTKRALREKILSNRKEWRERDQKERATLRNEITRDLQGRIDYDLKNQGTTRFYQIRDVGGRGEWNLCFDQAWFDENGLTKKFDVRTAPNATWSANMGERIHESLGQIEFLRREEFRDKLQEVGIYPRIYREENRNSHPPIDNFDQDMQAIVRKSGASRKHTQAPSEKPRRPQSLMGRVIAGLKS